MQPAIETRAMPLRFGQTTDPFDLLGDIVVADPIAAPLLLAGILLLTFTVGFVGVLSVGALLESIATPLE